MTEKFVGNLRHYPVDGEHGLSGAIIERFSALIDKSEADVSRLIQLPVNMHYAWFSDMSGLIPEKALMHCWAYTPDTVSLVMPSSGDLDNPALLQETVEGVFHELFHISQGFTYVDSSYESKFFPFVDEAIYEGAACVFEREYARPSKDLPFYADYTKHREEDLQEWLYIISTATFAQGSEEHKQWKFYHEELGINHIMYKVGAWEVDKALKTSGKSIIDFSTMTANEVLELNQI